MKIVLVFIAFSFFTITWGQGNSAGYALRFDGSGGYLSVPHIENYNFSKVTIEIYFYYERLNGENVDFLIAKGSEHLEIHTGGGSGTYGLRFIPVTSVYLDTDPNVIVPNNWYHVAFCYDPSQGLAKCYINGVLKNLTNHGNNPLTTQLVNTPNEIWMGKRSDNTYPLLGRMDEVRIWNVIRSEAEINAYKNSALTGNEPGLTAYYNFNEGAPYLSVTDNSPFHNTGYLNGSVTWVSSEILLPVELNKFSAHIMNGEVQLIWNTSTEVNNYGFEIERIKSDSENNPNASWEKVGFVKGSMQSNSPKEYSFQDKLKEPGRYLYRLKQIDADGKISLSKEIEVVFTISSDGYIFYQNYPNPFNPSTIIKFEIPQICFVSIDIFNSAGELVSNLLRKELNPGLHEVEFTGLSLSAGVYFYQIRAGNYTAVKKLILLK